MNRPRLVCITCWIKKTDLYVCGTNCVFTHCDKVNDCFLIRPESSIWLIRSGYKEIDKFTGVLDQPVSATKLTNLILLTLNYLLTLVSLHKL